MIRGFPEPEPLVQLIVVCGTEVIKPEIWRYGNEFVQPSYYNTPLGKVVSFQIGRQDTQPAFLGVCNLPATSAKPANGTNQIEEKDFFASVLFCARFCLATKEDEEHPTDPTVLVFGFPLISRERWRWESSWISKCLQIATGGWGWGCALEDSFISWLIQSVGEKGRNLSVGE